MVPTIHVYLIYYLLVSCFKQDQRVNSYSCGIKVQVRLVPNQLALVPVKCTDAASGHDGLAVGHVCPWRTPGAGF